MKKLKKVMTLGLIVVILAGVGLVGHSVDACVFYSNGTKDPCHSRYCPDAVEYDPNLRCECLCHYTHKNEPVPCYCDCSSLN